MIVGRRVTAAVSCVVLAAPPLGGVWAADYQSVHEDAKRAFSSGDYRNAAELFQQAFDIEPRGNLLFNIAVCWERAGEITKAVEFYQRFVDAVPDSPQRPAAQQRIAELKPSLDGQYQDVRVDTRPGGAMIFVDDKSQGAMGQSPLSFRLMPGEYTIIAELDGHEPARQRIRVDVSGAAMADLTLIPSDQVGVLRLLVLDRGAQITIDGRPAGTAPLEEPLRLRAGPHEVQVSKPGLATYKKMVDLRPGDEKVLKVDLAEEPEVAGGSGGSSGGGGMNIWPWVTVGAGAAALGGALFTGLSASGLHDELSQDKADGKDIPQSKIDDGNRLTLMTNVLLGVGTAAVIGGLAWWWFDDTPLSTAGDLRASVGGTPDGGAAFTLMGAF